MHLGKEERNDKYCMKKTNRQVDRQTLRKRDGWIC